MCEIQAKIREYIHIQDTPCPIPAPPPTRPPVTPLLRPSLGLLLQGAAQAAHPSSLASGSVELSG